MNQPIVDFYEGKLTVGRDKLSFDEIIKLPTDRLEKCHDYIQWLFPLPENSAFMKNAPKLDENTAKLIAKDYSMRVGEAVNAMMKFWDIELHLNTEKKPYIRPGQYWMVPDDHNHFRVSRVLRFLTLLSKSSDTKSRAIHFQNIATSLLYAVLIANDKEKFATPKTVEFWEKATKLGWGEDPRG